MADQEEAKKGASPTRGRNSCTFPVRFPSMICQWNKSWDRDSHRQRPCSPRHCPWIWRTRAF